MANTTEVKIVSDAGGSFKVAGYGVVWGGRDVVGDYFTKGTDFWFDRLTPTPMVLFQHGTDGMLKRTVVGQVVEKHSDDIGLWVEAQITASKKYADAIRKLVSEGILGWSSGSVPHLVQRVKGLSPGTQEITSWPIVELSLTPTPAEPRTVGVKELKSLAAVDSSLVSLVESLKQMEGSYEDLHEDICEAAGDLLGGYCQVVATFPDYAIVTANGEDYFRIPYTLDDNGEPVLGTPAPVDMTFTPRRGGQGMADTSKAQQGLARSDYAWVDSNGTGHLDISDEGHVRAAMARFNQTHFTEDGAKRSAARKIIARARSMGIQVDPDSTVAQAAKAVNLNELPDDAFGYVTPGTLDDDAKTFPRSNRHFPHHGTDGEVDPMLLEMAIAEAKDSGTLGEHALSHLLRHRDGGADAHTKFWNEESVAGQLLVFAERAREHAYVIAEDQKAMERSHFANAHKRVFPVERQVIKELGSSVDVMEAHLDQVESGDDGTARAEHLRRRLALLEI